MALRGTVKRLRRASGGDEEGSASGFMNLRSWVDYLFGRRLAPYVSSSDGAVHRMLRLAEVGPGDVLYDLGSGDGRIVAQAAKRGARAVGFEMDNELVRLASFHLASLDEEVASRVDLRPEDFRGADLSEATVLVVFLSDAGNRALLPQLRAQAKEDARLVSFSFPIHGLEASRTKAFEGVPIFLYDRVGSLARSGEGEEGQ